MRSEGLIPTPLDEARIQMLRAGAEMMLLIGETYDYYREQGIEPQTFDRLIDIMLERGLAQAEIFTRYIKIHIVEPMK